MNLCRTPPSHGSVKAKMAADRMPGTATGKMMSVMAPKRVAPWALPFFTVSLLRHLRGRRAERGVEAMGLLRVTGRLTGPTGRSEDAELLGAIALESLFLAVNPVAKRLIPVQGFVGQPALFANARPRSRRPSPYPLPLRGRGNQNVSLSLGEGEGLVEGGAVFTNNPD